MVFWNSPFGPLSPIQAAKGYAATPISATNRDVIPAVANAHSAFRLPIWNKLPAGIVNASSVKPFQTLLDANWQSLFPEIPT